MKIVTGDTDTGGGRSGKGTGSTRRRCVRLSNYRSCARLHGPVHTLPAQKKDRSRRDRYDTEVEHAVPEVPPSTGLGVYTNEDNPFGDSRLDEVFVWVKKYEREIAMGQRTRMPTEAELIRERDSLMHEVAAVHARQQAREREREERDRLRAEEDRLREAEAYGDLASKEEAFHLGQAAKRSEIRIRDGRERAVDVLAKNLLIWARAHEAEVLLSQHQSLHTLSNPLGGGGGRPSRMLDVVTETPAQVLARFRLDVAGLQTLQAEVRAFDDAERIKPGGTDGSGIFAAYWRAVGVLVHDALQRELCLVAGDTDHSGPGGVPDAVAGEVDALLGSKSITELTQTEAEVKQRIARRGLRSAGEAAAGGEDAFWGHVLKALSVYKARVQSAELHQRILLLRLGQLQRTKVMLQEDAKTTSSAAGRSGVGGAGVDVAASDSAIATATAQLQAAGKLSASGERTEPVEEEAPAEGPASSGPVPHGMSVAEAAAKGLGEEEVEGDAAAVVPVAAPDFLLTGKFKPRKPRFFHRVKTGWAWNAYNKAHYDRDTPPPKVVQGYKFTIFYPDLINKFETPEYFLEPADAPEFAIIR